MNTGSLNEEELVEQQGLDSNLVKIVILAESMSGGVSGVRVFVSSVVDGYTDFRQAAKRAIEILGHEAVLMEQTESASPSSPRSTCLAGVERSDVVVLLLGERYGWRQESDKSATHEEFEHACSIGKQVLAFVEVIRADEDGGQRERGSAQEEFVRQVKGRWEDGRFLCRVHRLRRSAQKGR